MKTWILLFCLFLASCSNRQTQSSDHENFYRIDFRPLVKNEAQEIGLNEWATNPRYVQLETNDFIRVKSIQRIILDDEKLLVVHSDRLSLFDKDGKYMYDVNVKSHFDDSYFAGGYSEKLEKNINDMIKSIEYMDASYKSVKWNCEQLGVKIFNSTRGGKLEEFPRIKIEDAINKIQC